jgi:hypothetical protein
MFLLVYGWWLWHGRKWTDFGTAQYSPLPLEEPDVIVFGDVCFIATPYDIAEQPEGGRVQLPREQPAGAAYLYGDLCFVAT